MHHQDPRTRSPRPLRARMHNATSSQQPRQLFADTVGTRVLARINVAGAAPSSACIGRVASAQPSAPAPQLSGQCAAEPPSGPRQLLARLCVAGAGGAAGRQSSASQSAAAAAVIQSTRAVGGLQFGAQGVAASAPCGPGAGALATSPWQTLAVPSHQCPAIVSPQWPAPAVNHCSGGSVGPAASLWQAPAANHCGSAACAALSPWPAPVAHKRTCAATAASPAVWLPPVTTNNACAASTASSPWPGPVIATTSGANVPPAAPSLFARQCPVTVPNLASACASSSGWCRSAPLSDREVSEFLRDEEELNDPRGARARRRRHSKFPARGASSEPIRPGKEMVTQRALDRGRGRPDA